MCEYKDDTGDSVCINSCPSDPNFNWDSDGHPSQSDIGDCDPGFEVCYSSDDVYGPCDSWPPHDLDGPWWLEEAGPSGDCVNFDVEACVYNTEYDGIVYGEYLPITSYSS